MEKLVVKKFNSFMVEIVKYYDNEFDIQKLYLEKVFQGISLYAIIQCDRRFVVFLPQDGADIACK